MLLLAIAGPLFARLVNAEIGSTVHHKAGAGRGFAIFALGFLLAYNGARYVMHARAVSTLDSRTYAGAAPHRVAAFPGPVNIFSWRGLAEMPDVVSIQDVNLLRDFDPSAGHLFYKPEPSPAIDAARRIRQQPWGKNMTLVALTAWGKEEDQQRSKEAGFDHHLVKPVNAATLNGLLADVPPNARVSNQ